MKVIRTLLASFLGLGLTILLVLITTRQAFALDDAFIIQEAPRSPDATTWYVNGTTGDDTNTCLGVMSACETVAGAVSKAAEGDTVEIAAGTYPEHLEVQNLTLIGAGTGSTFLDGNHTGRVLQTTLSVSISNLTIRHGDAGGERGGGIYNFGTLSLENVKVMENTADQGGAGIFNVGTLDLVNSEVLSNTSEGVGGGIYLWNNSLLTATNSLIGWNEGSQGGGIYNTGGLHMEDSILRDNQAALFSGGLAVSSGSANLERVTVTGNHADNYNGGISNNYGTLTLTNVTISGNSAPDWVGLFSSGETAQTTVLNTTIASNLASGSGTARTGGVANNNNATISIQNSIIANNTHRNCVVSGTWTSLGNNISNDTYCNFNQSGDLQPVDAHLAPLGDYGGPTQTHALLPSSPAIDAANNSACPASDQRGITRPFDGDNDGNSDCDIGAVESRNQLSIGDVSLLEGDMGTVSALFPVTLAPPSALPISVNYSTFNQTAITGSDYTANSGTVNFSPGEVTKYITVTVSGDTNDELNETFSIELTEPVNSDILDGSAIGTIIDDDGLPSITISDVSINEGNTGSLNATFLVSLSPSHFQTVLVNFTTVAGTATSGVDYLPASGTLTFNPGEVSKNITISVIGDLTDEGDSESFSINLSNPVNTIIADSSGQGTIQDDDIATVSLTFTQPITEGNSGTTPLEFVVELSTPAEFPVTVDYSTSDGGVGSSFATPGEDFIPISGTLTFDPGDTSQTVIVQIIGDQQAEEDEHFSLYLSNADPISIYSSASSGNIINDDQHRVFLPFTSK